MTDITLKSGRVFDAFFGVVGIDGEGKAYTGFDQHISDLEEELTPEEAVELANMMIERWTNFRDVQGGME